MEAQGSAQRAHSPFAMQQMPPGTQSMLRSHGRPPQVVHPYGSGAPGSAAQRAFSTSPGPTTTPFLTPPSTPRGSGTTRRDQEERREERNAARRPEEAESRMMHEEGVGNRVQDWISRLFAVERVTRSVSQEFVALQNTC